MSGDNNPMQVAIKVSSHSVRQIRKSYTNMLDDRVMKKKSC